MRITRIDIEGRQNHYARLMRRRGSDQIEAMILTPDHPSGRVYRVQADCRDDVIATAECVKDHLDDGTETDIRNYLRVLEDLAAGGDV